MGAMSLMTVNDSNVWDLLGKYLVSRQAFPVDALPFLTVCVPLAYGGSQSRGRLRILQGCARGTSAVDVQVECREPDSRV